MRRFICRHCGKSVRPWHTVCRSERCQALEAIQRAYAEPPPDPPEDPQ